MGSSRLCESPNRFGWLKSRMAKARSYSDQVAHELLPQVEILRAVQRKHAYPLFMAIGRVAVAAEGSRSNYLLDRVLRQPPPSECAREQFCIVAGRFLRFW